jgi:hypothetical protein
MKKLLCILAGMAMVVGVQAAEEVKTDDVGSLGVGYQGQFFDGIALNALSVRWNPAPLGGQVLIGRATSDNNNSPAESTLTTLQGKIFYTLIQRKQSQFYAGGKFGLLFGETTNNGGVKTDNDGVVLGALVGTEWRFSELPEIGFNFEVGYDFSNQDNSTDIDTTGIVVSLGAHYYF